MTNSVKFISRVYNEFSQDKFFGTVTKKSNTDRLKNEINYYLSIPEKYKIFFPRVIDYDRKSFTWMTIEQYQYDDLGAIVTNRRNSSQLFNSKEWDGLFNHLHEIITAFKKEVVFRDKGFSGGNIGYSSADADDCASMYITKTETEHENFIKQNRWIDLFSSENLIINGKPYRPFNYVWEDVRNYLISNVIPSYAPSIIHGDMCFPNILYGGEGIVRFIDPRGSFGKMNIYGDHRYDIAKLAHSVEGGYEFFNNQLFTVNKISSNSWEYSLIGDTTRKNLANQSFKSIFYPIENEKQITAIQGLIFVGAVARHYESEERQLSLYLTGIELLNKATEL